MFNNRVLDIMTRSAWWMVPLIWLPTSVFLIYLGPKGLSLLLIPAGMLSWTLTEYALHRFLFHFEFKSNAGLLFHKMVHGAHHEVPNDPYRVGTPLGISIPFAIIFGLIFYSILGDSFYPFYAGMLLGYIIYEYMHYAAHHIKSKRPWFMRLKRHHLLHHHSKNAAGTQFGVTNMVWDRVFGT